MSENVIEWLRGDSTVTVTFCSNNKYNSKVRKLAEQFPNDVEIVADNNDGSIMAHVPLKFIKLSAPKQVSEETRELLRERLARVREKENV